VQPFFENLRNQFFAPKIHIQISPNPFAKEGNLFISPFVKGGLRGIFILLCEPKLVRVSPENLPG